jgi:hypothetical protein
LAIGGGADRVAGGRVTVGWVSPTGPRKRGPMTGSGVTHHLRSRCSFAVGYGFA